MLWQIFKIAMRNIFQIFLFLLCYYIITVMEKLVIARELKKMEAEYAKKNEFPYMVSIRTKDNGSIAYGRHICDGVITEKRTVVTAAHCLLDKGGNYLLMKHALIIVAGTVYRTSSEITRKSESIFIHPAFDFKTKRHNLAIIVLNSPLPLDNITTKSINLARTEFPEGTQCIVSGWGLTNDNGSDHLQKSKVYIMPKDECVENYTGKNYKITNNHICAGVPGGRTRSCYGENGEPLVCNDFLYGISSFGFGCGQRGFPSVYSNVKEYTKFIEATSGFDALNEDGNHEYEEKNTPYYGSALFTLILFVLFVLCALYFNTYK